MDDAPDGPVRCFIAHDSGRARVSLRRFFPTSRCEVSPTGIHDAQAMVDVILSKFDEGMRNFISDHVSEPPHDDPRWPQRCACGFQFGPDGTWQVFVEQLYRYVDGNGGIRIAAERELPVGAMWDARWVPDAWRGPDGHSWVVRTPGGDWFIDSTGKDGGRWTRTGEAPRLTVRPSIMISGRKRARQYHGWLTDGALVPC